MQSPARDMDVRPEASAAAEPPTAPQPLFRFDPGWPFVVAGLGLLVCAVLIPAQRDLQQLDNTLAVHRALEDQSLRRLEAYDRFLADLDRGDEQLVRRLAASQLNLMPKEQRSVLLSSSANATVTDWIDASEPLELPTPEPYPDTLLSRLATGPRRLWVLASGVFLVFIGLLLGPSGVEQRRRGVRVASAGDASGASAQSVTAGDGASAVGPCVAATMSATVASDPSRLVVDASGPNAANRLAAMDPTVLDADASSDEFVASIAEAGDSLAAPEIDADRGIGNSGCLAEGTAEMAHREADAPAAAAAEDFAADIAEDLAEVDADEMAVAESEAVDSADIGVADSEAEDIEIEVSEFEVSEFEVSGVEDSEAEDSEAEDSEAEDSEAEDSEAEDSDAEDSEAEDSENDDSEVDDSEADDSEADDSEAESSAIEAADVNAVAFQAAVGTVMERSIVEENGDVEPESKMPMAGGAVVSIETFGGASSDAARVESEAATRSIRDAAATAGVGRLQLSTDPSPDLRAPSGPFDRETEAHGSVDSVEDEAIRSHAVQQGERRMSHPNARHAPGLGDSPEVPHVVVSGEDACADAPWRDESDEIYRAETKSVVGEIDDTVASDLPSAHDRALDSVSLFHGLPDERWVDTRDPRTGCNGLG